MKEKSLNALSNEQCKSMLEIAIEALTEISKTRYSFRGTKTDEAYMAIEALEHIKEI